MGLAVMAGVGFCLAAYLVLGLCFRENYRAAVCVWLFVQYVDIRLGECFSSNKLAEAIPPTGIYIGLWASTSFLVSVFKPKQSNKASMLNPYTPFAKKVNTT